MVVATGAELTEEHQKVSFVLDHPNRWLTLMHYLLNPPSIKEYVTQHCGRHVVGAVSENERITAARWVRQDIATLPKTQHMHVCADKRAVAWKQFHQCDPSPSVLQVEKSHIHLCKERGGLSLVHG
jgi:hypothetical protein